MDKYRILIVDDEEALRKGLQTYLELEGYDADTARSAEEALALDLARYDLVLLDIMMEGVSGIDMAETMKRNPATAAIPVIFLTAKDSDDDMVAGLNLGADDYIAKPYSVKNVLARIGAVLRRANPRRPGGIHCDRATLICEVDGAPIRLPKKEFELLALFLEHRGRIFSREELLDRVWPGNSVVVDRTVDAHIARLRGKIAPYGKNIVNRSGYGYGWQD
ncbi:MAG: response regulator transcription factor [[Clostridium] fimetarium]|nr:response regulator transcription factor [Alistipes timonensis]MCM1405923.1 response regulator transcription factor [[Clostridium] fimetarium]